VFYGVLCLGFCWVTYVYFLVYLEVLCAFFDIYNITYQNVYIYIYIYLNFPKSSCCLWNITLSGDLLVSNTMLLWS
jgi:hypothetical protein